MAFAATAMGATPATPGAALAPGAMVDNKYVVERVLGEGGMGVVYLARDRHIGLDVVLKAVRGELAHRADVRERMLAEGKALARIDHPNVVRFNAVVVEGDALWLVMQYVEGESLDVTIERLAAQGQRLPLAEALRLFRQVVEGVAAAHREGLIHRDLKPANVLVRRKDGVAKVGDFGIAKSEADAVQGKGSTRGTIGSLWYMSPEQVHGRRDLDKRVDVYALGIMLYEMLVGRVPFDADSDFELMRLQAEAPLPSVGAVRADVPPALEALLGRMTAKDRDHRVASCDDLLAELSALEAASPAPTRAQLAAEAARPSATLMTPPAPAVFAAPPSSLGASLDVAPHAAPYEPPRGPSFAATTSGGQSFTNPDYPALHGHHGGQPFPAPPASRTATYGKLGAVLGIGALVLVVGAIAFTSRTGEAPAVATGTTTPTSLASVSTSANPPVASAGERELRKLVGGWRSVDSQRDFDAVLVDGTLEFRIVDAAQFGSATYRSGDARFIVRATDGGTALLVEDRVRILPPSDHSMTPEARNTCLVAVDAIDGKPLRATSASDALEVEFARLEPKLGNFTIQGKQVTSCVGLGELPRTRLPKLRFVRR